MSEPLIAQSAGSKAGEAAMSASAEFVSPLTEATVSRYVTANRVSNVFKTWGTRSGFIGALALLTGAAAAAAPVLLTAGAVAWGISRLLKYGAGPNPLEIEAKAKLNFEARKALAKATKDETQQALFNDPELKPLNIEEAEIFKGIMKNPILMGIAAKGLGQISTLLGDSMRSLGQRVLNDSERQLVSDTLGDLRLKVLGYVSDFGSILTPDKQRGKDMIPPQKLAEISNRISNQVSIGIQSMMAKLGPNNGHELNRRAA